jgi:hypothetical protein
MAQETAAQSIKNQLKSSFENEKMEEFKKKPVQRQFYWGLVRPSVEKENFLAWLCSSGLKGKMESLTTAAQNQVLNTCYHQRNIMQQPTDRKYRMCCKNT